MEANTWDNDGTKEDTYATGGVAENKMPFIMTDEEEEAEQPATPRRKAKNPRRTWTTRRTTNPKMLEEGPFKVAWVEETGGSEPETTPEGNQGKEQPDKEQQRLVGQCSISQLRKWIERKEVEFIAMVKIEARVDNKPCGNEAVEQKEQPPPSELLNQRASKLDRAFASWWTNLRTLSGSCRQE